MTTMQTPTEKLLLSMVSRACDTASLAAYEWANKQGITKEAFIAKLDAFTLAAKPRYHAACTKALADAKEAAELGMIEVAKATFIATFVLAGIEAAKEVFGNVQGTHVNCGGTVVYHSSSSMGYRVCLKCKASTMRGPVETTEVR